MQPIQSEKSPFLGLHIQREAEFSQNSKEGVESRNQGRRFAVLMSVDLLSLWMQRQQKRTASVIGEEGNDR